MANLTVKDATGLVPLPFRWCCDEDVMDTVHMLTTWLEFTQHQVEKVIAAQLSV
jgi:hypothetical protein